MSEPNVMPNSIIAEAVTSDRDQPVEVNGVAAQTVEQLEIQLEVLASHGGAPLTSQSTHGCSKVVDSRREQLALEPEQAILTELRQTQSLNHGYVERIHHLEQALDQSQASLRELQHQMVDQQFLENQLAATEEISNIQQQAITHLKSQLEEQQKQLSTQVSNQLRDRDLQALLVSVEDLTEQQQAELQHVHDQIARDHAELHAQNQTLEAQLAHLQTTTATQQQRCLKLEAQFFAARLRTGELEVQLEQAQTQITQLNQTLTQRQAQVDQLEADLKKAQTIIEQQPTLILEGASSHRSRRSHTPNVQELAIAQGKVEELETEVVRQLTNQAMLQRACQELEQTRDQQQLRVADLEGQTADMQEQILRQAQQASEYELAIQHLKDRYFNTQSHVLRVQKLLEQALNNLPPELAIALADLQAATSATELPNAAVLPPPKVTKVDLPEFLMRRRNRVGIKPGDQKSQ